MPKNLNTEGTHKSDPKHRFYESQQISERSWPYATTISNFSVLRPLYEQPHHLGSPAMPQELAQKTVAESPLRQQGPRKYALESHDTLRIYCRAQAR